MRSPSLMEWLQIGRHSLLYTVRTNVPASSAVKRILYEASPHSPAHFIRSDTVAFYSSFQANRVGGSISAREFFPLD